MQRKLKHEQLLQQWYEARPDYDVSGEFVGDGPSNWETFNAEKPRILFILKESRLGFHPNSPDNTIWGTRGHNVIRWSYLIKQLYQQRGNKVVLPDDETLKRQANDRYHHIAEIELKKKNEELSNSNDSNIWTYAKKDADFLEKQIELIAPHIIVCCGNFYSYKTIFEQDFSSGNYALLLNNEKQCYQHRNRLVIDFNHPSYSQIPGGNETHIRLLHQVLDNGKVFENFSW